MDKFPSSDVKSTLNPGSVGAVGAMGGAVKPSPGSAAASASELLQDVELFSGGLTATLIALAVLFYGSTRAFAALQGSFDVIWSEGAAYILGFEKALRSWRPLLASAGHVAVTEVTWLHSDPPADLRRFWETEYPAITDAAEATFSSHSTGATRRSCATQSAPYQSNSVGPTIHATAQPRSCNPAMTRSSFSTGQHLARLPLPG